MSNAMTDSLLDSIPGGIRQDPDFTGHTWVAFGPAGALGSVHGVREGYTFKLFTDGEYRGTYPTLEIAESALYASLLPGSEWPEFRAH